MTLINKIQKNETPYTKYENIWRHTSLPIKYENGTLEMTIYGIPIYVIKNENKMINEYALKKDTSTIRDDIEYIIKELIKDNFNPDFIMLNMGFPKLTNYMYENKHVLEFDGEIHERGSDRIVDFKLNFPYLNLDDERKSGLNNTISIFGIGLGLGFGFLGSLFINEDDLNPLSGIDTGDIS